MIHKFVMPLTLGKGILLSGSGADARDGCGLGFHRDFYGWCRPNIVYRPFVYGPAYPRFGFPHWGGYRYGWRRRFAWHQGGYHWGGFRHAGWHGGWGWHRHW